MSDRTMGALSFGERQLIELLRENFQGAKAENVIATASDGQRMQLLMLAKRMKVLPQLMQLGSFFGDPVSSRWLRAEHEAHLRAVSTQVRFLGELASACRAERLRFVLLKGLPLSERAYGDVFRRKVGDLDLLVDPMDVPRMNYILRSLGCTQPSIASAGGAGGRKLRQVMQFRASTSVPYPMRRRVNAGQLIPYYASDLHIKIEVHDRIEDLPQRFTDYALWSTSGVALDGTTIRALDRDAMLVSLLATTFENAFSYYALMDGELNLRDIVDLHNYIINNRNIINIDLLKKAIEELGIADEVRHVLEIYNEVYGCPCSLLEGCIPSHAVDGGPLNSVVGIYPEQFLTTVFNVDLQRTKASNAIRCKCMEAVKRGAETLSLFEPTWINVSNRHHLRIRCCVVIERENLIVRWRIPRVLYEERDMIALKLSLIPVANSCSVEYIWAVTFSQEATQGFCFSRNRLSPRCTFRGGKMIVVEENAEDDYVQLKLVASLELVGLDSQSLSMGAGLIPAVYLADSPNSYLCFAAPDFEFTNIHYGASGGDTPH